jgi:hypothetical protein
VSGFPGKPSDTYLSQLVRLLVYGYCVVLAGESDGRSQAAESSPYDDHIERFAGILRRFIPGGISHRPEKVQAIAGIGWQLHKWVDISCHGRIHNADEKNKQFETQAF